jgi:hypothetical protein
MKQIAIKTDCGAAMCFIGHTLDLAGYKMYLRADRKQDLSNGSRCDYQFVSPDGEEVDYEFQRAKSLLGLTWGEASDLFEDWSIKTPQQAVKRLEKIIQEASAA